MTTESDTQNVAGKPNRIYTTLLRLAVKHDIPIDKMWTMTLKDFCAKVAADKAGAA
jgi:hypothetical protein